MKKTISILMTVCMLISCISMSAFAVDTNSEYYDQALELIEKSGDVDVSAAQVANDLEMLDGTSFGNPERLTIVGTNESGNTLYEVALIDDISSVIFVSRDSSGNKVIDITENGIHNVLTYANDGLYADGNLVTFSHTTSEEIPSASAYATPRIAATTYSTSPVYNANYSHKAGPTTDNEVSMGMKWINTSLSVVSEVMAVAFVVSGLSGIGDYTGVYIEAARWAINQGAKIPGQDACMSFSYYTYSPTTQPASSLHWKIVCNYYYLPNCTGASTVGTFYENYYY